MDGSPCSSLRESHLCQASSLQVVLLGHKPEFNLNDRLNHDDTSFCQLEHISISNWNALASFPSILLPLRQPLRQAADEVLGVCFDNEGIQRHEDLALLRHVAAFLDDGGCIAQGPQAGSQLGDLGRVTVVVLAWNGPRDIASVATAVEYSDC